MTAEAKFSAEEDFILELSFFMYLILLCVSTSPRGLVLSMVLSGRWINRTLRVVVTQYYLDEFRKT